MIKFFNRDTDKDNLLDIFIEIDYNRSNSIKSVEDIKHIEEQFKQIKGIYLVNFVGKKSDEIPDIIALAKWDENEIDERINELQKIPNVQNVKYKRQRLLLAE